MKKNFFRSVDFWKTSLVALPDNALFELLRTVFGKIKTPFNKQLLMADLEKFLSRNDIKKNIARYIDSNDNRIIAAVAILNEPERETLESFFFGEFTSAELNDIVVNLEERFILYRFPDSEKMRLALNPVLMQVLTPLITDTSLLFPSFPAEEDPMTGNSSGEYRFDDRILAALLSFVSHNETFFNSGGSIRKKIHNDSKTLFPGLPMETIIGSLTALGLFIPKEDKLIPDYHRFRAFGNLNCRERMEYCAAGIYCYQDYISREHLPLKEDESSGEFRGTGISPWLFRSKVRSCAVFIHHFLSSLEENRLYPAATLNRLSIIQESEYILCGKLLNAMKQTGLLILNKNEHWQKSSAADAASGPDNMQQSGASIVMDSSFSIVLHKEIEYKDAVDLAAVSLVTETGMNIRFEMNRDSAVSAFNRGITAEEIIKLLQKLSNNRIDNNLIFTLRDWEKSHKEVVLHKGLILTLSPERRYLVETKPLAALITETLAPGIYLLPETAEDKVSRVLGKAGVTIIARRGDSAGYHLPETAVNTYSAASHNLFSHLTSGIMPIGKNNPNPGKKNYSPADSADTVLKEEFHSILNRMNLGSEERNELSARIDRRLVLCESQLKDAHIRYEKLEARGLDYAGKSLIVKQAIAMQAQTEVLLPGRQKQESIYGFPKALEKTGGESILVIETAEGDMRIPLGKISMLRRIKKSIFESVMY